MKPRISTLGAQLLPSLRVALPAMAVLFGWALPLHASVLVYEGFSYGGSASSMAGMTATGTGLSGNYAAVSVGSGSQAYVPTGLTFSSGFFPVTGGALQMSVANQSSSQTESAIVGVSLNTGAVSGTVYQSMLFQMVTNTHTGNFDGISTRITDAQTVGTNSRMVTQPDDTQSGGDAVNVRYDNTPGSGSGPLPATGTTYLMISKWTNVGLAGGGTANLWVLSETGYESWRTLGSGLEGNLATYSVATATRTDADAITLNNNFLQFAITEGSLDTAGQLNGIFDEIRLGTTLQSVAVPEPSALLAVALGAVLLAFRPRHPVTRVG